MIWFIILFLLGLFSATIYHMEKQLKEYSDKNPEEKKD